MYVWRYVCQNVLRSQHVIHSDAAHIKTRRGKNMEKA